MKPLQAPSDATGMQRGMARPGFFFVGPEGVIREKYFEVNDQNRFTPNDVMQKMFPELAEEVTAKVDAPHLGLTLAQSDQLVAPGSRVSLIAEMTPPSEVHVYSPGVQGYKPLELELTPAEDIELASQAFPKAKILFLQAINEKVPVFDGQVPHGPGGEDRQRVPDAIHTSEHLPGPHHHKLPAGITINTSLTVTQTVPDSTANHSAT